MTFASPNYAYLLFVLPVIALLKIWADARGQRAVKAFASSDRLRATLLGGASAVWSGILFGMQLMGLGFFIIALTRPQFGIEQNEIEQTGRNIFIAIDTSKSMLADDMAPNRLTRAKLAALDLLEKLPNDRVGLIAFAGRSFLQAPLTTDHQAVAESINSLDHTTIPRGGSSLGSAIDLAVETVAKMPGMQHGMVIFSDGQETDSGTLQAAKTAAQKHLLILPVGVGTIDGALIPDPAPERQGDYVRDENGNVVKARLEVDLLQQVAKITGGDYIELNSQALTQQLVDRLLVNLDKQKAGSRQQTKPIERYQWPLFIGMLLIVLSLIMRPSSRKLVRQGAPLPVQEQAQVHAAPPPLPAMAKATLILLWLSAAALSQAASIQDVKKARDAYDSGSFEIARDTYSHLLGEKKPPVPNAELSYGLGASMHQLKNYDRAVPAFSEALKAGDAELQKRALRGLGTTLYDEGDSVAQKKPDFAIKAWTDSRDHFNTLLDRMANEKDTPAYKEVKEDRDFVQKRLDEVKKQQEEKKQQQGKGDKDKKDKQKQKGDGKGESEPDENGEGDKNQDPKEPGDKQKEMDATQKDKKDQPGEGEIKADPSAGANGPQNEKQKPGQAMTKSEDQRNDKTGFSPTEARDQLRNYADDQKSVQYLMKRERPAGGKDY